MKREYKDYLFDIVDAIEKIEIFTKGLSYKEFVHDEKTLYAVIRAFEIIGEDISQIKPLILELYKKG